MEKKDEKSEVIVPSSAPNESAEERAQPEEATTGAPAASEYPADLPAAYERLLAEKEELYDRLLRKQAELENYRKRLQREKEEHVQHANLELVRTLLPVLDGFERALKHQDSGSPEQVRQGMELIYRGLRDALHRAGLTAVETQGKLFDPHVHQAVEAVEAAGHRDQEILEELQRGYKFKHRLLRPAVVKVAIAPGAARAGDEGEEKR